MEDSELTRPRALVLAASTRSDSFNRKLAREAFTELERTGVPATLVDLREFPLPLYDGDFESSEGLPPNAKALKELIRRHDALVIASPEYNGSFSALLKNLIDWTSRPEPGEKPLAIFRGKPAALLSASPGPGGGRRGLKHLRELLDMIGVTVIAEQLTVPRASEAFDPQGGLTRSEDRDALAVVIAGLARAIQSGREAAA
jgi:NAD(P)H-dependent FMN reductase